MAADRTVARRVCPYPGGMAHGTVKFFKPDKGWGAITSPELPGGFDAWVHFSAIEADGYRALETGDQVEFDYEAAQQDSFRFRATRVRKVRQPNRGRARGDERGSS